jgi:hypothetical protein
MRAAGAHDPRPVAPAAGQRVQGIESSITRMSFSHMA